MTRFKKEEELSVKTLRHLSMARDSRRGLAMLRRWLFFAGCVCGGLLLALTGALLLATLLSRIFIDDGYLQALMVFVGVFAMAAGLFGRFFNPEFFDSRQPQFFLYRALALTLAIIVMPNVINLLWPFHVVGEDLVGCWDNCQGREGSIPRGVLHHPDAGEEKLIRDGQYGKTRRLEGVAIVIIVSYGAILFIPGKNRGNAVTNLADPEGVPDV